MESEVENCFTSRIYNKHLSWKRKELRAENNTTGLHVGDEGCNGHICDELGVGGA